MKKIFALLIVLLTIISLTVYSSASIYPLANPVFHITSLYLGLAEKPATR